MSAEHVSPFRHIRRIGTALLSAFRNAFGKRRKFPPAVRNELKPFHEHWAVKREDYLDFYGNWEEFIKRCRCVQIDEFPNDLMYDWIASWAQNVFFGFFLPGDSTVSQERFDSAVLDLEAFMDAFRFVFPRRSYPEARRFCAYIPGVPGMSNLKYPVGPRNALLDELYPMKPPGPDNVPHDQPQLLKYASLLLNNPSLSDWEMLRTLSWETDPEQAIWHPERHFARWEQMIRESMPILRENFRINLFPSTDRSKTIDELIQRAADFCNDIGRVQQSLTVTRESVGATPPAVAAEKPTVGEPMRKPSLHTDLLIVDSERQSILKQNAPEQVEALLRHIRTFRITLFDSTSGIKYQVDECCRDWWAEARDYRVLLGTALSEVPSRPEEYGNLNYVEARVDKLETWLEDSIASLKTTVKEFATPLAMAAEKPTAELNSPAAEKPTAERDAPAVVSKNSGGRPSLADSTNPEDIGKLNVYELIRIQRQANPTGGAKDLLQHFKGNSDFKTRLSEAGLTSDVKMFVAALKWIKEHPIANT